MPRNSNGGGNGGGGNGGGGNTFVLPDGAIGGTDQADFIDLNSSPAASTTADDVIYALGGNDTVYGDDGYDTIYGGDGDDTLYGGNGDDIIFGEDGNDVIFGDAGSDIINGGSGDRWIDVAVYEGVEGIDYRVEYDTMQVKKGRFTEDVITEIRVYTLDDLGNDTGEVDTLTDVEQVLFVDTPATGTIITQGEVDTVQFDETVTVDVLANDYLEGGNLGEGLTISNITDVLIDLDQDGVNDIDLIPDAAESDLSYFVGGGLLNDGSILTLNPDDTLTWDPNGAYDGMAGGDPEVIQFWYEASDGAGATEFGDVTLQVTYPPTPGDITFETMNGVYDDFTASLIGYNIYQDGPNGEYFVSQVSNALDPALPFELRDEGATSFDYDGDGDDEFRVWSESDGTSHEMNVTRGDQALFDLGGMTFTGLDDGETATVALVNGSGQYGEVQITNADLDPSGVLDFTNATDIQQFTVLADADDEFWVDDIFFI